MKTCPGCKKSVKPDKDGKCPDCGHDMGKVSEEEPTTPLAEGAIIDGDDLAPLVEAAQLVVPKRGGLFEEKVVEGHKVKVGRFAIIRPCQSRGRRIRGHAPIYEPRMLAENAGVFKGWPMYLDHMDEELAEEIVAFLQERGRSIKDLGGRVINSFYDPDLVFEDDSEQGYRKGGVVGEVVPQKLIREMLEEDPGCLNVSINAWPKKVRIGSASWDSSVKGALIEGIRSKPMGSVDFVFKGGAGGRPLTEDERRSAVSLLESAYSASRDEDLDRKERPVKKLSEMSEQEIAGLSREQLAEALKAENPSLAEAVASEPTPSPSGDGGASTSPITQEQLDAALNKQRETLIEEFKGEQLTEEQIEERAEEIVQEREELRGLAEHASKDIAKLVKAGLPDEYAQEIAKNYMLLPSGARAGIVVQEADLEVDGKAVTAEEVVTERIKADARTALKLIEAAGGTPRVKGLGPSGGDGETEEAKEGAADLRQGSAFTDFLVESGDITGDAEKDKAHLTEMLEG